MAEMPLGVDPANLMADASCTSGASTTSVARRARVVCSLDGPTKPALCVLWILGRGLYDSFSLIYREAAPVRLIQDDKNVIVSDV